MIEEQFEKAYEPMIGALERHPRIRLALHYTGPLIEWMSQNRPETIDRLRALLGRGQVEILGGGYYEPILVSLPARDRLGQLRRMREELTTLFGTAPTGAWLAERVWEPSLPADLVDAGYTYTVLDDNHLRGASVPDDRTWGTYITDDQGRMLTLFATEKGLRYRIPWQPVDDLIDYLRDASTDGDERVGIMGDDGEKFGSWPGTYELCWGKEKWIDRCFTALEENAEWLSMVTPAEWMERHPPIGRVYVPTSSYIEMTEWALPPEDALVFHELLDKQSKHDGGALRFVRGGFWRNFMARYREINDLHKQMLRASAAVEEMPTGERRDRALDHLYRGQSNDCYWHGLFGGIYIVHMRMATLAELIAAEDLALGDSGLSGIADYDLDGIDEVLIGTVGQTVLVDVAEGAGIGAWDLRASRVALASVVRRRPEAYHAALRRGATPSNADAELIAKQDDLRASLEYDDHERRSGLVRIRDGTGQVIGDFTNGSWECVEASPMRLVARRVEREVGIALEKVVELGGGRLDPTLTLTMTVTSSDGQALAGTLEAEFNVCLSGGGSNPQAYYRWADGETRHDVGGSVPANTLLSFGNEGEGVDVEILPRPVTDVSWNTVETVSNSEAGFERTYQGSCLIASWPLRLGPGDSQTFELNFRVTQLRDARAEEVSS